MKRRVMIAKALSHEPDVLFLDEPTAGVDVNLRRDMWALVRRLRERGVTIILTTHYIEEAEEMADRIGVIDKGRIAAGRGEDGADAQARQAPADLTLQRAAGGRFPPALADWPLELRATDGPRLIYTFDAEPRTPACPALLRTLDELGVDSRISTPSRSSLEDIFVDLVGRGGMKRGGQRSRRLGDLPHRNGAHACARCWQSVATPVITTALYFIVFGGAIGSRMQHVGGVRLWRVHRARPHHAVAADAEHLQRLDRASTSRNSPARSSRSCRRRCPAREAVLAYVGAAATKSIAIGLIILLTATLLRADVTSSIPSGWSRSCC